MLEVLEPFKVRDGHTTSVAKDIREEADSLTEKYLLGCSSSWAIGSFNDEFTLEFFSIVSVDSLFEGGRDEEITRLCK